MGCTQSTERKAETQAAPQPVASKPVAVEPVVAPAAVESSAAASPVASPAKEAAPAAAPKVVAAPEPEAAEIAPSPVEAHQAEEAKPLAIDIIEPSPVAEVAPAAPAAAIAAPEPVKTPTLPPLALQKMEQPHAVAPRSKTPAKTSKASSRTGTPRKENSGAAKGGKTPVKATPSKKSALGDASVNAGAQQRKVAFEAVPLPTNTSAKNKARVKKIGGKHACNVQEEMFLASIAAFERQLTHRSSLDSQLNSR